MESYSKMKWKSFFDHWMDHQLALDEIVTFARATEAALATTESTESGYLERKATPEELDAIFAAPVQNIARCAAIITVVMVVEQHLKGFARLIQAYENVLESMTDGSVLKEFRIYCLKAAKWAIPALDANWQNLNGLFQLRNCIVHHAQDFRSFEVSRPSQARALLSFIASHRNDLHVADNFVYLEQSICQVGVNITRQFLEKLSHATGLHYSDDYESGPQSI